MDIKTACSSAGIALHEALESIRQEKITAAIITGSNLIMGKHIPLKYLGERLLIYTATAPGLNISLSLLGSLSPEGSSKSFDASADGYARGEAVSALYIKRLDEAIRDGNPIRAVIRSSATNVYVPRTTSCRVVMESSKDIRKDSIVTAQINHSRQY